MRKLVSALAGCLTFFLSAVLSNAQTAPPQRPLVFVPGVLGSRLCSGKEIIWGNRDSLKNFSRLELNVGKPALTPCGIVDEIQILGSLWTHNTYKTWLKALDDAGYSEKNKNLFIFAYDWRLSTLDNAKELAGFITRTLPAQTSFDLLAHSMGGILARIYLEGFSDARNVRQVYYLGTPFLGSMNTFGTIKEGWGWPLTKLAGGQEVVARTLLSFPGVLDLLPRYDECCYIRKSDGSRREIDIFDPAEWKALNWLPPSYANDTAAYARLSDALRRSKDLTELLSRPARGVYEKIYASDIHDTYRLLGMREGATRPQDWVFTSSKGDGTVPVWSVARSRDSRSYSNTLPSFSKHEHLFDDKWVISAVIRQLIDIRPDPRTDINAEGRPAITVLLEGTTLAWPINLTKVTVGKGLYRPGEPFEAEVLIQLEDTAANLASATYKPTAYLSNGVHSTPLDVRDVTSAQDLQFKRLRFSARGVVASVEGVSVVRFQVTDRLEPSQAFYVSAAD